MDHLNPSLVESTNQGIDLEEFCQEIRQRACLGEFDKQAFISQDIVEKLKKIGVYRALLPRQLGGNEWSPRQFCELIEKLSMADGSVGWVASFGMSPAYLGCLPEESFKKLYQDGPDVIFAGGIYPPQPAQVTDQGLVVNGRWKFSSGCMSADVLGVGIAPIKDNEKHGLPRMAVFAANKAKIEMTWDTVGLKGTGSHDLVVEDVCVDDQWTFVRGEASTRLEPFFKYPALSFATQVLAVVSIGVAAAALAEFKLLAPGKSSITGGAELAQRPITQYEFAKIEAEFIAARTWFYHSMDEVWNTILNNQSVQTDQISNMRLSATHAVRVAARVARQIQMLAGMAAINNQSPFSRFVNDCNVVTQHAFMGDLSLQNAGAMSFGLAPMPGYL